MIKAPRQKYLEGSFPAAGCNKEGKEYDQQDHDSAPGLTGQEEENRVLVDPVHS